MIAMNPKGSMVFIVLTTRAQARGTNQREPRSGTETAIPRCLQRFDGQPLTILRGDCREVMKSLPDASVNCCVTSPPYWGLRDYGYNGQLGLERTPEEYVRAMVAVFAEVRRVLRDDGTLWLNL